MEVCKGTRVVVDSRQREARQLVRGLQWKVSAHTNADARIRTGTRGQVYVEGIHQQRDSAAMALRRGA